MIFTKSLIILMRLCQASLLWRFRLLLGSTLTTLALIFATVPVL